MKYYRHILCTIIPIFLVVCDYGIQNFTYPFLDSSALMAWVDRIPPATKKEYFDENDVTYVNFSKDKALVPVVAFGDTIGNDVITDRETLLRFLKLADGSGYRYIFLDIRFEKEHETPYDSALFQCIATMPRLIVANHRSVDGYEIADSILLNKAAFADYRGSMFSGFTRYEFLQDGQRSVALRMFKDIDGHDIQKHWYGYSTEEGFPHLCYNLKYIPLPDILHKSGQEMIFDGVYGEKIRYPYAGSSILNPDRISEKEARENLLRDKIVIVGDFDNDLHGTYIGEVPGPVLSFAAYKYLHAGLHKVTWWYTLILFLLFFLITLTILTIRRLSDFFKKTSYWRFVLSLLGFGALFFIIKVILYKFFLISMVMIVPTLIFHVLSNATDFQEFVHERKLQLKK